MPIKNPAAVLNQVYFYIGQAIATGMAQCGSSPAVFRPALVRYILREGNVNTLTVHDVDISDEDLKPMLKNVKVTVLFCFNFDLFLPTLSHVCLGIGMQF